ncbi:2Fe-2S iron-sulfur cluster-binding protein [Bradyrhizobium sp. BTAi1]|uniref:2Fe-2S iron-sulfur cluster-binding protein n=1 Tax=Bradyrhizobium sp. (strain BTAi1 / ATCC BAA-1182) TaxID=288000 RepID=UPI0001519B35|nr:2Fe-2S iron-sulfur cluster-binding protein [Bradyrhizobium sp. BTAi1]ABQ39775.1 Putative NADH oxidoreductase; putative nitric oxide dioxygenase [Bradyrhizobium sp. BTAi1]
MGFHEQPGGLTAVSWFLAVAFLVISVSRAPAQMEGGHGAPHSEMSVPPTPSPNQRGLGMPGMGEMGSGAMGASPRGEMGGSMGEMGGMGEMGRRPAKEFYPSLMNLPTLSAEQRRMIEAQAQAQITNGTTEIANAESALRQARSAGDSAAVEQAAGRLRDGLSNVKSGATTLRALAEGKSPPQIAQAWFKSQLSIPSATASDSLSALGLSWFHVITMAVVATFATAMLAIYFLRMRRASALVERLTRVPAVAASSGRPPIPLTAASKIPPGSTPATGPGSTSAPPAAAEARPEPLSFPAARTTTANAGPWKGKLRVAAIFPETKDVKTFRLKNPDGGPVPFSFLPGQFLTYSAEIDGKLVRRSYTIASSAAQSAYVETTIKREEPGIFSDYMHDKVVEGDLLEVAAPSGTFTFTGKEADSVVFIGGGVGITPLMAAIRYLFDTTWKGETFLVYGAQSTAHFIFRDELEYLQRRMHNLHVAATMARAAGTSWMGAEGHITREFLLQSVPEITSRRVHLCGPPGMMQAMKKLLAELGVPPDQVKTEAFGPARGAVPPPGVTQIVQGGAAGSGAGALQPTAPAIGPATATIRFAKSDKLVPLPPDKTVLEVAESIGVPIDYSCRIGICGTCKTKLLEGKVTMEVEEALTPEDKAQNIVLACQAKSVGNLVVEA